MTRSNARLVAAAAAAALALLIAQLWLIGRVELMFDEAYYSLWSRKLEWGYLDHPPVVAAWIRASTDLFGGSEFGVRALNTLIIATEPALVGWIAWRLFASVEIAALAALLWLSMPLVAGAPIVTPDGPLVVFWTLALAGLVEVWRGRAWGWAAVSLALGLGLMSKFTAAFLGVGIALALVVVPSMRRWRVHAAPYAAALGALVIVSPFLLWNAEHGWATFSKQFARVPPHGFAPRYLGEFLASQIGLANPLTMVAAIAGLGGALRGRQPGAEPRVLLFATIGPAAGYFLLHSLHDRVQGNWTAPLYPALAIVAADSVVRAQATASFGQQTFVAGAGRFAPWLGFAAIALIYAELATGFAPLGATDPMARLGGWRELTREVEARAREQGAAYILTRSYATTSLLTYYGDGSLPVVQRDQRERWSFEPPASESLFVTPGLAFGEANHDYRSELARHFRLVEEIARPSRLHAGRVVEYFVLYRVGDAIGPVLQKD